ncbi:DUF72 domain-containing protein [Archaeoglobus veneficus]|uniref:DUF72 domain-containing protein n=1 Tax=Archaeoglobus veneficus (strain DSM 11195 / SNP6) TaxID=693661 RepID=F2KP98_ARCVS|nr:DUF72 domain-containing protein [Archaeoglobus veneficus]AEA47502.1 protein of unknown function DUF72 [Archaeoglobus veneficus SNP6]
MIKVGCCGFCEAMNKYFQDFKLVEVQKTFYKPPKPETAGKWRKDAPSDFEFTVKAWQVITHPPASPTFRKAGIKAKDCGFFKPTSEVFDAWEETKRIAEILDARVILFQTPASFKETPENVENMRQFFSSIERDFTFVWEPRGWSKEAVKKVCEELNLVHCVDPFVAKPLYGEIAYLRLHGTHVKMYRHRYSDEELAYLLNFCRELNKEIYVLFNNVYMCEDAKRFISTLKFD